jgi:hypothetical protein
MSNLNQDEKSQLLILLQNSSNLRTGQDQVVWRIFGSFWSTNALLLISMFSIGEKWNINEVGIIVSSIGILISIVWTLIQIRAIDRITMHENSMIYIENQLELNEELRTYSKKPIESFIIKIKARIVMSLCCYLVTILWICALTIFICSFFHHFKIIPVC